MSSCTTIIPECPSGSSRVQNSPPRPSSGLLRFVNNYAMQKPPRKPYMHIGREVYCIFVVKQCKQNGPLSHLPPNSTILTRNLLKHYKTFYSTCCVVMHDLSS